jgi:hypothetical protein
MKRSKLLFIGCFLALITIPLVFMDHKSLVSEKENKTLEGLPNLFNGNFPRQMDNYINDRFGFRDSFVSLANMLNMALKKTIGNVVIGKNGWLFYSRPDDGNNIYDFFKMNLFTGDEIKRFIESIEKRIEWCANNDIKFIFLIAPNKHNVYPEYYPFTRPKGITRAEQIMAALPAHLEKFFIFPLDYIRQNKTDEIPLYFETDTHWNMTGAYCAFELLFENIQQLFPRVNFPEIPFVTDIGYDSAGDMVPMLGRLSYGRRTVPDTRPRDGWEAYYQYIKNESTDGVITVNNSPSLPKAIIFRDSFFTLLEPFTSARFSHAEYNWRWFSEPDKKYVLENKPDIIIWEIVERSVPGIIYSEWK